MKKLKLRMLLFLVSALAMATVWVAAQPTPRPMLADYFTQFASTLPSAGYAPLAINETVTEDLNGDGNQDLVVLGANYPGGTVVNVPQPGRVFLGDGNGHFTAAPTDLFPVDTLMTVHPSRSCSPTSTPTAARTCSCQRMDLTRRRSRGSRTGSTCRVRKEGGGTPPTTCRSLTTSPNHRRSATSAAAASSTSLSATASRDWTGPSPAIYLAEQRERAVHPDAHEYSGGPRPVAGPTFAHNFTGATLADLNGDGLPELIVTAVTAPTAITGSTTSSGTALVCSLKPTRRSCPRPGFPGQPVGSRVERIDVNQDGLPDLVLVGTQRALYSGWFVQIFINKGNRQFVDETAGRVPPEDASGQRGGPLSGQSFRCSTSTRTARPTFPWNSDRNSTLRRFAGFPRGLPLIWLNDGTGHFSTLKVGDFVAAGERAGSAGSPISWPPGMAIASSSTAVRAAKRQPEGPRLAGHQTLSHHPASASAAQLSRATCRSWITSGGCRG